MNQHYRLDEVRQNPISLAQLLAELPYFCMLFILLLACTTSDTGVLWSWALVMLSHDDSLDISVIHKFRIIVTRLVLPYYEWQNNQNNSNDQTCGMGQFAAFTIFIISHEHVIKERYEYN